MPSTLSPCCTPVVIYDSSDEAISSDESVQAGFSTDDDNSYLLIPADCTPFQSKPYRSISSTIAVAGSTVIPSSLVSSIASTGTAAKASDLLCTNVTSLEPIYPLFWLLQWLTKRHCPITMVPIRQGIHQPCFQMYQDVLILHGIKVFNG